MTARRPWFALALTLLAPALAGLAADKDQYGDPLPDGAKARLGTARLRVLPYATPVLTPDGKTLIAQVAGGSARLDPATGALQGKLTGFYGVPTVVSHDGKRGAYASFDRVTVVDLDGGKSVCKVERRLPGFGPPVAFAADGKLLAVGGVGDRGKKEPLTVLLWDVDADKEVKKFAVPQNEYANVALSADGKVLAAWGSYYDPEAKTPPDPEKNPGRVVTFWGADGKELSKFRVQGYRPAAVALSADGALAAVAGDTNSSVNLVETKTGASKHLLLGRSRVWGQLAFSPDGANVAAVADDGLIQRWKVADGAPLSSTEPPVPGLTRSRVQLVSGERGVAHGTKGAAVVTWEVPTGKLLSPAGGNYTAVRTVAVTPDNKFAVTSAEDGTALKWELATGKPAGAIPFRPPQPTAVSLYAPAVFSPDLARALVRTYAGVSVYDVASGTELYSIPAPADGFTVATFSAGGSKAVLATPSYNPKQAPARVSVWDVASTKRLASLDLPGVGAVSAALAPDGKRLVTAGVKQSEKGSGECAVAVWDAAGQKKGEYSEEGGFNTPFAAAAPDSKSAAVVTSKGALAAFDLDTAKLGRTFDTGRRTPVAPPAFSPDGKSLAVACQPDFATNTAPVLVFDWQTGKVKHTFASSGPVVCLAFSPDGKWLVTGSSDTTATVWDLSQEAKGK